MVSLKSWSDFKESDYTPEQWHAACLIHQHEGAPTSKAQCKLPVRTPSGEVNRNGVHAAAAALAGARGGVQASSEEKSKAANILRRLYANELDEDVPDSLQHALDRDVDAFFAHFGIDVDPVDDFFAHYGIKGMRWGIRRNRAQLDAGSSEDAAKANEIRAKVAKSGVSSLSNQEMQHLVQRMNLEQQYARATYSPSKLMKGKAIVNETLAIGNTMNNVVKFVNSPVGKIMMDKAFPNNVDDGRYRATPKEAKVIAKAKKKGKE